MSTFPRLKTQAITQYPSTRITAFSTGVLTFMDGKEQRFREYSTALRSWTIDLSLLDDGELADLEAFFIAQNGSYSSFDFEDPWDGTIYTNCTLDKPEAVFHYIGNQSGSVRLVVQQNRS